METSDELLKLHGLRKTPARKAVLALYREKGVALSHGEVESELGQEQDRVTLYRTLRAFVEKGLLHKVLAPDGEMKYALCGAGCDEAGHKDEHVHFHCKTCGSTYCFYDVPVPEVRLPSGFRGIRQRTYVEGVCRSCQ